MRCKSIKVDGCVTVTISGEVEGQMLLKLKKQIRTLLTQDAKEFVFDLRGLSVEARLKVQTFLAYFRKASRTKLAIRVEGSTPLVPSDLIALRESALRNGALRLGK